MAAKKNFLGFIDTSREIGRPALIGVEFFHQRAMRARDVIGARTGFQAKDLIGLLFRHFSAGRRRPPRCRVTVRVFTPAGIPAIKIRCQ